MKCSFLPDSVEEAVARILEDIGSSRALTVAILLRYGEYDQLSALEIDPRHYLTGESYWRDASATSLLSKLQELPTTVDRKAAAEETFRSCERECFASNVRLYGLTEGSSDPRYQGKLGDYLNRAKKLIADILGPCPDLVIGRFGPGATFADRGRLTTIPDKMTSVPTFTHDAWPFLVPWTGTLWAKACASSCKVPSSIPGNRFSTVPKDCRKDRGIAIEPSINLFYQLGYGRVIRSRLRRWGIHLSEGQDIHRRIAREASTTGRLATLDLKNASDTICRNLVKLLLPPSWFAVLDALRSKKTLFRGDWHLLEKFSSMGNGFTFELESLIFLAICASVREDGPGLIGTQFLAFGDDLIVPTESAKDVIAALSFFGLKTNPRKSFVDGPFRESCGGDYFDGVDVRPHYLKLSPQEPQQLISLMNGLRRRADNLARWVFFHRGWLSLLNGLPVQIRRLRGPEALGDIVIHDDQERWQTRHRCGIRYVRVYRPARFRKVPWSHFRPDVLLASAVYGVPEGDGGIIPRDSVAGYKIGWVAFS